MGPYVSYVPIILLNVFHHLPDVAAFLREAQRALAPGGRVLILDQHRGWISEPILRWAHHEPYEPGARDLAFASTGPLSGADGALAWIVFERDRERLAGVAPELRLERHRPAYPLSYWLAGGLKPWSLLPGPLFGAARAVDAALAAPVPRLGSFVEIDLVRA
jgi:SAM-dependent methyltransferase